MNAHHKLKKTQLGVELVRLLASEGDRIFSIERARELCSRVDLKESYLAEALYHLRRNGWIVSLRRGLYAISSAMPGVTHAHEFEIGMKLVTPVAISHWSAMHYHNLTEQAPRKVFLITTSDTSVPRARGAKSKAAPSGYAIGNTLYQFVQVQPQRFFGIQKVWIQDTRISITDPERTLVDGLSMPQYCGDFAEVLHAFHVLGDDLHIQRIIDYAIKFDAAVTKRLGWVLEHQGIDPDQLKPLASVPINGYRKLDASGPRKGRCNRRWMIQENLPGKVLP